MPGHSRSAGVREEEKGPCTDAASIPTSQWTVLQHVVLTGDFRLLLSSLMPPLLQCRLMPFVMAWLYIPVLVSLPYKFLPVPGSITFIWDGSLPSLTEHRHAAGTRREAGEPLFHHAAEKWERILYRPEWWCSLAQPCLLLEPSPSAISSCTATLPSTSVCDAWLLSLLPSSPCHEDHTASP